MKMAGFIEEFYYGNLDPQLLGDNERRIQKELAVLAENEALLTDRLTGQELKLFLEYVDAWAVVLGGCTLDNFITGFRLGASFAYDTFVGMEKRLAESLKG